MAAASCCSSQQLRNKLEKQRLSMASSSGIASVLLDMGMFWDFGYVLLVRSSLPLALQAVTFVITAAASSAPLGFLALVREFSGSVGYKGPSYAAAAAATPWVDVEKGPQAGSCV